MYGCGQEAIHVNAVQRLFVCESIAGRRLYRCGLPSPPSLDSVLWIRLLWIRIHLDSITLDSHTFKNSDPGILLPIQWIQILSPGFTFFNYPIVLALSQLTLYHKYLFSLTFVPLKVTEIDQISLENCLSSVQIINLEILDQNL